MFKRIIGVSTTRTQNIPAKITAEALRDLLDSATDGLNSNWRLSSVSKKKGGVMELRYSKKERVLS